MEFNEEQKSIINDGIDKNILVSAAAGSGKTTVLTERIIRKLLGENCGDKTISLSNILVMTFTKKATAEMKKRIKDKLENEIIKSKDNSKLIRESATIQNANISTIDAFCKRVLEENYTALDESNSLFYDFDPSYRVADGKEIAILQDDVLDNLLEKEYGNNKYKNIFDVYVQKTDESRLRSILNDGISFLSSVTWPVEYLDRQIKYFNEYSKNAYSDYVDLLINDYKKSIVLIEELEEEVRDYINACNDTLASGKNAKGNALSDKAKEQIRNSIEYLNSIIGICSEIKVIGGEITGINDIKTDGFKELVEKVRALSKTSGKFVTANTMPNYDKEANDEFKSKVEKLIKRFKVLIDVYKMANLDEKIVCNENDKLYMELLKEYYLGIVYEKKKRNVYEISDFARLVLDILYDRKKDENGDDVRVISSRAKAIGDRYQLIFVDEYQDTNFIQEKILAAISDDFAKGNVFMVGDVKQSIYGFRNAEPSIFVNKYRHFKNNDGGVNKTLSVNYRSTKEIIGYVNDLFSKTMTLDYGDIDYSDGNALTPKDDEINKEISEDAKVDIRVISKVKADKDEDKSHRQQIEYEADYVATKIEELVNVRNKKYSDIVILLRAAKDKGKVYEEALQRHKIPCYTEQKTGFFQKLEIRLMTDILEVIDNPLQNIPLAAVLVSSIFELTNDELAFIKVVYSENILASAKAANKEHLLSDKECMYYDALKYVGNLYNIKTDNDESINVSNEEINAFEKMIDEYSIDREGLKAKISRFFDFLLDAQFRVRYLSISDLIWYIYDKLNVKIIMSAKTDGKLRNENLDNLYNFAVNFENSAYVGLFNFNRYIEKFKEVEVDQGQARIFDENANVVRIMTIHSSKGLQFDTVFLCGCNSKYRMDDVSDKADYQFDQRYGFALDFYNRKSNSVSITPKKSLLAKNKKDETLQEELRMLYVALTRAEKKLYIVGFAGTGGKVGFTSKNLESFLEAKDAGKNTGIDIMDCDCYLDVVLANYPVSEEKYCTFESIEWDIEEVDEKAEDFDFGLLDTDERDEKSIISSNKEFFDSVSDDSIKENLTEKYEYADYQKLKPKFSVSAIKKEHRDSIKGQSKNLSYAFTKDDDDRDDTNRDKKTDDKMIVTGKDLGNAYHRFMQFYDYENNVYNNPKESKTDLSADRIVSDNKLKEFLGSKIGKEMANAYKNRKLYREYKFMKLYSDVEIDKYMHDGDAKSKDINVEILNEKNIIIQGIIDAFYVKKDEKDNEYIVLVDYKTDSMSKNNIDKEELKKSLLDNYKVQLDIYANALRELTGMEVKEKYLYSFAIDEAISV